MKITILDPVMCCNTVVCGTEVDDRLVETASAFKEYPAADVADYSL